MTVLSTGSVSSLYSVKFLHAQDQDLGKMSQAFGPLAVVLLLKGTHTKPSIACAFCTLLKPRRSYMHQIGK